MKKILTILLCIFALPCLAESRYELYYQSENEQAVQLTVVVYGEKEKNANGYACLNAVQTIIFDGIQGSKNLYLPFVQDEQASYNDHAAFYHNLFDRGGFWSYIIASSIVEKGKKDKQKYYVVNVNINYKALKENLASHNVMRRFGV